MLQYGDRNRKKIVRKNFGRFFCLIFQNVLQLTAVNSNYTDPNNLKFEEIKILGALQEITAVTVSQNNIVENYPLNITYYPTEKVKKNQENGK